MRINIYLLLWIIYIATSCSVSFKGIAIDPSINSFHVKQFKTIAPNSPQLLAQNFTERLKNKIRNDSRLKFNAEKFELEYSGTVKEFAVQAIAPKPNEQVSYNQLRITIQVELSDNTNDKKNWSQDFSFQQDFPSNVSLLNIQDQLIKTIFDQIVEDIFNKSFTDW
jgi:Lipopolysaccharide-assembly